MSSISKFSKDVFIVTSEYKDYSSLDNYNKNIATKVIEHLISRITKLGFHNFYLVGDDSLSIEVNDEIKNYGLNPYICDMYPDSAKEFLVNNVITKSRTNLIYQSEKIELPVNKERDLQNLNATIERMLKSTVKLNETIPSSEKVEIIKRVLMHKYFGYPISEATLYQYDKDYPIFLHNIKKTDEELEQLIRDDIDYRWSWAQNLIKYSFDKSDEESQSSKSIDLMDLLGELLEEDEEDIQSNVTFGINKDKITYEETDTTEDNNKLEGEIRLVDGLSKLSKEEALQSESLVSEMTKVINYIDDYTNIIYSHLIENTNLIIDLYVSTTSPRSRKLPYKNGDLNKMILSIDLKSGEVELFFKGSPFKLNPFFEKEETVKTNVMEW